MELIEGGTYHSIKHGLVIFKEYSELIVGGQRGIFAVFVTKSGGAILKTPVSTIEQTIFCVMTKEEVALFLGRITNCSGEEREDLKNLQHRSVEAIIARDSLEAKIQGLVSLERRNRIQALSYGEKTYLSRVKLLFAMQIASAVDGNIEDAIGRIQEAVF